MNDKQIGVLIGGLITCIITIPSIYIVGRKGYKMGVKDGAEINQNCNNVLNEIKDMMKDKDRA